MNKYLNVIIIAFFSVLAVNNNIGFCIFIPVVLMFASINSRSLILIIPLSLLSTYFFNNSYFVQVIILYVSVLIYMIVLEKKHNYIIDAVFVFLVCFGLLIFNKEQILLKEIYLPILYSLISALIYIVLKFLIKLNQGNFVYFELIAVSVSILGSTTIEFSYNIPFILGCFYAMYFSCSANVIFSLVFSICLSAFLLYFYRIEYSLVLPLISALYSLNNIISSFILVAFGCLIGVFYPQYFNIIIVIDVVCVFFELFKFILIIKRVGKCETYEDIYKKSIDNLNKNVLAFSTFLDSCIKDIQLNKEYYQNINEGITSFKTNYCGKCYMINRCKKENVEDEINSHMRELIINCKKDNFDISLLPTLSVCPFNVEMKKSALIINDRITSSDLKAKNKIIDNTLSGISLMLRQYTIDNNIKKEMDYEYIYKIKKALADNGYSVCYFECLKMYENDFNFIVGIRGFKYSDIKEDIKSIVNNIMYCKVDVEYNKTQKSKLYISITPQKMYEIEYSSSSIASGSISGDNMMIVEDNGKFISLICDGMGKGSKANTISCDIIKLLNELIKTQVSTYAAIQILNTYCMLRKNLEVFSTLDLLDINQQNGEASIYKLSAAPTYIYHDARDKRRIEKIECSQLPLGNEIDIENISLELSSGDLIIMSSDGIFENVTNEEELENFISSITYMSVEKIVYQIINYIKNGVRFTDDDITLIVIRLKKR